MRRLTDYEHDKIEQILKANNIVAITYGNVAKIIATIFTISIFLFLYFEIAWGYFWIYLGIGILLSILEIIGITKIQTPYIAIKDNNCSCFVTKMLSNRKVLIPDSREVSNYHYYVTVNIEGEVKEVEYIGNEFDYLTIDEEMLIIHFKNIKKEIEYICFSNKEVNG